MESSRQRYMGGLHDPGFISTCSKEKDGPFGTCPGHINGIYQFQLSMVLGNSLSLHPLIPPFPEIQKNLRPKHSSYDLSLSFYISNAHSCRH